MVPSRHRRAVVKSSHQTTERPSDRSVPLCPVDGCTDCQRSDIGIPKRTRTAHDPSIPRSDGDAAAAAPSGTWRETPSDPSPVRLGSLARPGPAGIGAAGSIIRESDTRVSLFARTRPRATPLFLFARTSDTFGSFTDLAIWSGSQSVNRTCSATRARSCSRRPAGPARSLVVGRAAIPGHGHAECHIRAIRAGRAVRVHRRQRQRDVPHRRRLPAVVSYRTLTVNQSRSPDPRSRSVRAWRGSIRTPSPARTRRRLSCTTSRST